MSSSNLIAVRFFFASSSDFECLCCRSMLGQLLILANVGAAQFSSFGSSFGKRPMPEDPDFIRNDLPKNRRFKYGLSGATNPKTRIRKCNALLSFAISLARVRSRSESKNQNRAKSIWADSRMHLKFQNCSKAFYPGLVLNRLIKNH